MIKNITLALILSLLIISCGKKGEPQYKNTQIILNTPNIPTINI
tara:strand:- start:446 stop:577 length:132 start_codon:yes stop_codon:yes gene_type:complete